MPAEFCHDEISPGIPAAPRYPGDPGMDEGAPRASRDFRSVFDDRTMFDLGQEAASGGGARVFTAGAGRGQRGGLLLLGLVIAGLLYANSRSR